MVPGQGVLDGQRLVEQMVDIHATFGQGVPPSVALKTLGPAVQSSSTSPRPLDGVGQSPITPAEDSLQQAGIDIVPLDLDAAQGPPISQVLMRPREVLPRPHAVPLERRVGLGNEIGHARGHRRVAASLLLADLRDGFRHLDDAVQIFRALPGKPHMK